MTDQERFVEACFRFQQKHPKITADLLAACEAMLNDIDSGDENCWCLPDAPDSSGTTCEACRMRAAVARAKGEQS